MKKRMLGIMTGVILVTMLTGSSVWAADITVDDAAKTALEKAGVSAGDVAVYKKVWEFSDGREKYGIHFLIPGQIKYDYEIDAITGDVLSGETDNWEFEDDAEYSGLVVGEQADPLEESGKLEEAVLSAIKDAGLNEGEAIVCKAGTDYENGQKIFDVDFFIAGQTKFDYEINAATGEILRREQDFWEADDDLEYKGLINPGEAAMEAAPGAVTEEAAVSIAIKDAGFAEGDVTVTKCRRDIDDGIEKYDISFRTADGMEYDYDIDVASGNILEKDVDMDMDMDD